MGKAKDALCINLRYLRAKHGYSKKKMAEICGIGVASLNRIEQGDMPPRAIHLGKLQRIAEHFQLPPETLLTPLPQEETSKSGDR